MVEIRKNGLIVDWDGVAHLSLEPWLVATQQQLLLRRIELPPKQVATRIVPHLRQAVEYGVTDPDKFINQVVAQAMLSLRFAKLDTALWKTLLNAKSRGLKMAIVSNSTKDCIQETISNQQPTSLFFSEIITPEHYGEVKKPNPLMLEIAMKLLGCEKGRTKILGDSLVDIKAGQNAGIETILWYPLQNELYYDYDELQEAKPTYIVRTAAELDELLAHE